MESADKEIACLETEFVKVTLERDSSVEKSEQFVLEAQCMPGLTDEVKKLGGRVSAVANAARAQLLKTASRLQQGRNERRLMFTPR